MGEYVSSEVFATKVLNVRSSDLGHFEDSRSKETWQVSESNTEALRAIRRTASYMKTSSLPVGFPTETVYGLGADATRSEAVKGIYKAKGRPSDNPLIVHICDLRMLRSLMVPEATNSTLEHDPIPEIYKPLIERFWPGPLTLLLPNPPDSRLAPEVTASLKTFGVRMPDSALALSLISLAGVPLAAPSANASTKPSPTTAGHVLHDLNGRIEFILDGGACQVGVESTVVDGLCDPPVILRPGGLSLDDIKKVPGWEGTVRGYKDESELGSSAPRAPGMKYKHYSPKAKVVLYENGASFQPADITAEVAALQAALPTVGIIRSKHWKPLCAPREVDSDHEICNKNGEAMELQITEGEVQLSDSIQTRVLDISLGSDTKSIAHGLFAALRALDIRGADLILVEGIADEGDIAAAVMNRLRKAASEIRR